MSPGSAPGAAGAPVQAARAPAAPAARPVRQALRVWAWPVALGVLTASGLLSALVSDGWGDTWSWAALGMPVAVMGWFALARRGRP